LPQRSVGLVIGDRQQSYLGPRHRRIIGALGELDRRGFTHAGAGANLAAAAAPAYRRTADGTVALVAMASGAMRDGAAATTTQAGVHELHHGGETGLVRGEECPFGLKRVIPGCAGGAGSEAVNTGLSWRSEAGILRSRARELRLRPRMTGMTVLLQSPFTGGDDQVWVATSSCRIWP
jgi:hypothetical protein